MTNNERGKEMVTCFKCAKIIKGEMIVTNPPMIMIKLGIDFPKSYHPKCYQKEENEAKKELELRG